MALIDSEIAISDNNDIKEYIYGVPYLMSPVTKRHNLITHNILASFRKQLRGRKCRTYGDGIRCIISKDIDSNEKRFYEPDVFIVCNPIWKGDLLQSVPNLVVEVVSKESVFRDTVIKSKLYAQMGIQEYIKVTQDGVVLIYTLDNGAYKLSELERDKIFKSNFISDLELLFNDIYDDLD